LSRCTKKTHKPLIENISLPKRVEEKNMDKAKAIFERAMKPRMLGKIACHYQFQDMKVKFNFYCSPHSLSIVRKSFLKSKQK